MAATNAMKRQSTADSVAGVDAVDVVAAAAAAAGHLGYYSMRLSLL